MDSTSYVFFFGLLSLTVIALAYDPDTLQDLCVADRSSEIKVNGNRALWSGGKGTSAEAPATRLRAPATGVFTWSSSSPGGGLVLRPRKPMGDPEFLKNSKKKKKVNGFTCKPESNITAADFFFAGIGKPAVVNNTVGSAVTGANVEKIAGLNTLGVSLARIDYAPGGLNPPHTHPRATEVIFVLEGELDVGFITTANKLFAKTVKKGEVFVFPRGLVHYQKNNDKAKPASVISAFNSQLPGTQSIAATLFAATPAVPDHVLTTAFQIGTKEIEKIKSKLAPKKG